MNPSAHRPVVVGFDGSDGAQAALAHGAWEADRRGCPLQLVSSYNVAAPYGILGFALDPGQFGQVAAAVQATLVDAQRRIEVAYPRLEVHTSTVAGSPAGLLIDTSAEASLVVVGSRGLGGFAGLMLGSVGAQLAAHSKAPVIVMRPPGEPGNMGAGPGSAPVVVGIDGIPGSEAALEFAFDEAAARGAVLRAMYAWWMLSISALGPTDRLHYDVSQAEDEVRRLLAEATAGWRSKYPEVEVELVPAHAVNPIVAVLDLSRDAGLLVVSRHGGNALTRLLLGSVGDVAVREASGPVAVVPERTAI
jgi:nucleotide-binding universal stress UspA family protein